MSPAPQPQDVADDEHFGDWLLNAVPDGLWVIDDEGGTTYANPALLEMLGIAPGEAPPASVFEVLDEPGGASFRHHLAERVTNPAPGHDLECWVHRRDGSAFWAHVSHVQVRDGDGAARGWLYRLKDDTQHRALFDEVVRHQDRLAEAQAIAGVGSWERLTHGPVSWSPEAYRICRVDPETFEPSLESFFELLHPDDRDDLLPQYRQMLDGGAPLDAECRLRPGAGDDVWLRLRGVAVHEPDGDLLRVGGTVQDVTEAKNYQRGLEFLSAMARAANESATLQDVLIASDTRVRPYARWPAVLVASPSSPDADADADLTYVDLAWAAAGPSTQAFARTLADLAVTQGALVHRTAPHGHRFVAGPVLVGGRLACVIVSDTGSSDDPQPADLAFFEQTLVLLAQVAEREWAAEELATARDGALAASRAKSDFLATMSHEIRTPLNGVIGLSELLRRSDLTSHQQRLADGVDQAGRTLLALVNDILDLSKIEAGRLDLEEVDFDPRSVVEQSAALVADRAREKGVELVVSSALSLAPLVRGDPVRFGQVITNLASNAVKFTAEGEVVIRAEQVGAQIRVSVRDTGVGIAPELHDGLFDAFTQADSSTTREYGGTGLGLAISKRIVTAMNGEIGVQSAVGLGSTFWFTAPFATALAEPASDQDARRELSVAGLRVLVVDDNATNRFILTEQLSGWAIEATSAASVYEALVELDAAARLGSPFEVVLLDYMMPGADGEQLARILRAESRHDDTRIVLLSSSSEPTTDWLRDAGVDSYLPKPVLPSHLLDTLARLGGRWETTVETPGSDAPDHVPDRGRVLVVEDNAINQLVAEGVLRRLGFTVQMADNGAAGVAAVADAPSGFALILMDCQMPVMDGFDATRAIRAIEHDGTRTPIIAMTAAAGVEERARCLDAGMNDFMSKPFDVRLMVEMLDRWVPATSAADAGPHSPATAPATAPGPAPTSSATAVLTTPADPVGAATRLAELIDGEGIDLLLVARMVERFEASADGAVAGLGRSVAHGSTSAAEQHAHALRGSAANLGLREIADHCAHIENAARQGRVPTAAALGSLGDEVRRGVAALHDFVRSRTDRSH